MQNFYEETRGRLEQLAGMKEEDVPLGKACARREVVANNAIRTLDTFLSDFSDGTKEEMECLYAEIVCRMAEKLSMSKRHALSMKELKGEKT